MIDSPEGFETLEVAEERRQKLLRRFEAYGGRFHCEDARKAISGCTHDDPCHSGACPRCMREFRLRWHSEVMGVLRDDNSVYRLSFVPDWPRPKARKLRDLDLDTFVAAELRALQRALPSKLMFLGGVDFSLNVRNNGPGRWQPHVYAMIVVPAGVDFDKEAFREIFQGRAAPKEVSKRPVTLAPVQARDWPEVATYAIKAEFYKRSSYNYERQSSGKLSRNVRSERLAACDSIELACFLHRYRATDRLLLIGVKKFGPRAIFVLRRVQRRVVTPEIER